MADIFSGNGFTLSYNEDTGNRLPKAISNIEIDELAAFPVLAISSSTTAVETYDSEYQTKLLSEQDVQPIAIVVNYIPDNSTHEFLDEATDKGNEFQLVLTYNSDEATSQVFYAIVNGVITGASVSGDQNSVLTKTYSFQPTELVTRSTTQVVGAPLSQGDYGVGSNTTYIPQYETDTPSGNAFIKVPAATPSNPAGTDLMGIGMVDATDTSALVTTKTGALNVYAKNQTTAWTRIYTVTQSDATYVPLSRTVNGHVLNANVVVSKADVGLGTVTDNPQLKIASNLSDLANVVTARSSLGLGTAAVQNIGTTGSVIPLLSTANTWSGVQTFVGRTFITDLSTTATGTYNGTGNVSLGVTGVLPLANGGTGGSTAALARTSLGLGTASIVNIGTSGATIPLLSTANTWSGAQTFNAPIAITSGGTGAGTATDALINLGALPLSGGVITGKTTVNNNIHVVTQTGTDAAVAAGTEVDVFYAGTNSLALGDTKQKTLIRGNGLLSHGNEVATYDVYTTGNKPSATDTGALPITGGTLTGALVGTVLTLSTALSVASGGTGNTSGTVAALTTARTFVTDLASNTAVAFNGTANNSHGVTGILPIANGGNGNAIGLAASATVLATPRAIGVNLASTMNSNFDGSAAISTGVTGILPLANGGTGNINGTVSSLTTARTFTANLGSTTAASFDGSSDVSLGVTGTLPITSGGTGAITAAAARTALGVSYGTTATTVAVGNDSRLNTINGKTGGTVIGAIATNGGGMSVTNNPQSIAYFSPASNMWQESTNAYRNVMIQGDVVTGNQYGLMDFLVNNNAGTASIRLVPFASPTAFYTYQFDHTGQASARVFAPTSDERLKDNITVIPDALSKMGQINGVTFNYKDSGVFGIGFIAQDVEKVFPDAVSTGDTTTLIDGTIIDGVKRPDTYGVAAALHHEAIKELYKMIIDLQSQIEVLKGK